MSLKRKIIKSFKQEKKRLEQFKKGFDKNHRALWGYRAMLESLPLDANSILVESQQGRTACGNMFYVVRAILSDSRFADMRINFVVKPDNKKSIERLFETYGMSSINLVEINSGEYLKLLASSKYLITDTSFPVYYLKREGQIVWNTWHGTPLKHMGRKDEVNPHNLGNVQKNLALADYLSFPNGYTAEHMIEDYMLKNISSARVLYGGYPRNEAFFNEANKDIVDSLNLAGKRVYAYMPTWRPRKPGVPARYSGIDTMHYLTLLDDLLDEDEVLLVNVHPLARKAVYFKSFSHVKEFPSGFETYDVLNVCDVLITDYSSVMFDFAVSGKKIVLFDYDRETYLKDRGLYLDLDELPFPKTRTPLRLLEEARLPKNYDDAPFLEKFCPYDGRGATERLCESVFFGGSELPFEDIRPNGKDNVLIYTGNLAKNGITSSLGNLLASLDLEARNYFLTFDARAVAKNKSWLKGLPPEVSYLPRMGKRNMTLLEKLVSTLYQKKLVPFCIFDSVLESAYACSFARFYGSMAFDVVIQFNGYDYKVIYEFSKYPSRTVIFVHSNMLKEAETRGNQRLDLLRYAYNSYDCVAVVSDDLLESTECIAKSGNKLAVVTNQFDYRRVEEMSQFEPFFDPDTVSNYSLDEALRLVDENVSFFTIGRFSPEKQHAKLIASFDTYWRNHKNSCLVIVGGVDRAGMYEKTCEYAASLPSSGNIVIIKSLSNPYAWLKLADGFILSSKYEGLGLVLLEAIALGIPVASTDVCGCRGFLGKYGGMLVEDSEEGIYEALVALGDKKAPLVDVDFDDYNRRGLHAFERAISGEFVSSNREM